MKHAVKFCAASANNKISYVNNDVNELVSGNISLFRTVFFLVTNCYIISYRHNIHNNNIIKLLFLIRNEITCNIARFEVSSHKDHFIRQR